MKTKEEIDAEFDNEFLQWNTSGQFNLDKISPDKIKSFWHKKLSQQKQEMVKDMLNLADNSVYSMVSKNAIKNYAEERGIILNKN